MKNHNNFRIYLMFIFLVLIAVSCMDPVVDKDESYSDFEDFDASAYLNDPSEGFLNGGFSRRFMVLAGVCALPQSTLKTGLHSGE